LPTGEQFDCPAQQSILSAAHAANILVSSSCRSGQCGSCLGKLLSGEIEYPEGLPDALSQQQHADALSQQQHAAGFALFCSAHATSDLVIELTEAEFPGG